MIVTPRTFTRWMSDERGVQESKTERRKPGRPRTKQEATDLILRIARETGLGSMKIQGVLKKLGITIGLTSVAEILLAHGFDPGPKRGEGTWS